MWTFGAFFELCKAITTITTHYAVPVQRRDHIHSAHCSSFVSDRHLQEHYISSLSWRPQAACGGDVAHLALTSLDGTLRLLAVDRPEPGKLDTRILRSKHFEGRLTGGCWTGEGEQMVVSCKNQLLAFEFLSGTTTDVGVHEAAVCGVKWAAAVSAALSGSFDMTLRLWDARSRAGVATVSATPCHCDAASDALPCVLAYRPHSVCCHHLLLVLCLQETIRAADRVFGFDVCGNKVVAALADQSIALYDLRRPRDPIRTIARWVAVQFQLTCLCCVQICS